jgi:hypothetical protein
VGTRCLDSISMSVINGTRNIIHTSTTIPHKISRLGAVTTPHHLDWYLCTFRPPVTNPRGSGIFMLKSRGFRIRAQSHVVSYPVVLHLFVRKLSNRHRAWLKANGPDFWQPWALPGLPCDYVPLIPVVARNPKLVALHVLSSGIGAVATSNRSAVGECIRSFLEFVPRLWTLSGHSYQLVIPKAQHKQTSEKTYNAPYI